MAYVSKLSLSISSIFHPATATLTSPMRMFGAIRAKESCLDCHSKAKEGDLLGAFTYYLDVSVDQVER